MTKYLMLSITICLAACDGHEAGAPDNEQVDADTSGTTGDEPEGADSLKCCKYNSENKCIDWQVTCTKIKVTLSKPQPQPEPPPPSN